jgi:hypothetical protein
MRLSERQILELRRGHAVCVNEACDTCRKVLGSVRYTRRGEPGEWCSEICRDGRAATEHRQARRAGRPRLKLSAKGRLSHRREQVREAVNRHRLSVIKNGPQPIDGKSLADAILRFGYPPSGTGIAPRLEALR